MTLSTISYRLLIIDSSLLNHFLELLIDYRSVEAVDGDLKPIAFFPFHKETASGARQLNLPCV